MTMALRHAVRGAWIGVWIGAAPPGAAVAAQQPRPAFEVVSVRPQTAPLTAEAIPNAFPRVRPGGAFNPTRTTVELLIRFAYDLQGVQIVGGPEWIRRDPFEVDARAGADVPAGQIKLMVQSLLAERFGLTTRMERRDMRHLALVLARTDGRMGPYMQRVDDCGPDTFAETRKRFPPRTEGAGGRLSGCAELPRVATLISDSFGVPVIDGTGLEGSWVFSAIHAGWPNPLIGRPSAGADDPRLPSVGAALEEQLGLKLETRRGPIDVLVIEAVQQPTEN